MTGMTMSQYTISAKNCANIESTSDTLTETLTHCCTNTQTQQGPLIYHLCTAASISSNWHQLQSTCIPFLTESWARAFGPDSEKAPQTTPTSNTISVHALHAGYKAAREQRLAVFMCLACLSVNWWSLWSLSVNATAVAKGQAARWRLGRVGWHMLGWGATREREEDQMKETAVYKWQACIAHRLPLRDGLVRSLSSFKAPEPAAMHKETQKSFLSHTHTHSWALVPVCCLTLETLCVCMPAWACQPGMILGSKCSGSEDLWELPGDHRMTFQNGQFVSV